MYSTKFSILFITTLFRFRVCLLRLFVTRRFHEYPTKLMKELKFTKEKFACKILELLKTHHLTFYHILSIMCALNGLFGGEGDIDKFQDWIS
jgi:hypothetical protein